MLCLWFLFSPFETIFKKRSLRVFSAHRLFCRAADVLPQFALYWWNLSINNTDVLMV